MEELMRWLGEQLDDDEEEARRGYLKAEPIPNYDGWNKSTTAGLPPAVAARVLNDIDADRKLIGGYAEAQQIVDAYAHPDMYDVGRAQGLEEAVRYRALRYEDRPGYKDDWRP